MARSPLVVLVVLAFASVPGIARADVPPPNVSGCNGKKAGEACKTDSGSVGQCAAQTCSRLDYSQTPPGSVSYPCTICVEASGASSGGTSSGTAEKGSSGTSGGSSATGGTGPTRSGCATSPGAPVSASAAVIGLALAGIALARRRG